MTTGNDASPSITTNGAAWSGGAVPISAVNERRTRMNILLAEWNTPFGVPPFADIRTEDFAPALAEGMRLHDAEIEAIAENLEPPTFENTIEALERSGRSLERTCLVLFNLESMVSTPEIEAVSAEQSPRLAAHYAKIASDPRLLARFEAIVASGAEAKLPKDSATALRRARNDAVRAGAGLGKTERTRLGAIAEELAALENEFSRNLLADEDAWVMPLGADQLDGLGDGEIDAARKAAAERGLDGHVITASRSSIEPFLEKSTRRELREAAWRAWTNRGANPARDNRPIVPKILALRTERARILGFPDFPALKLDDSMAKSAKAVRQLLEGVLPHALAKLSAETKAAEKLVGTLDGGPKPWDRRFLSAAIQNAAIDIDAENLRWHFEMEAILAGAFDVARRLFGLSFEERRNIPVHHPDARAFVVLDRHGKNVGALIRDDFARKGKRSGAWMSSFRVQEKIDGPVLPVIINCNNFAKGEPTLLSLDDARTLLHELGHALHGLMSDVRLPSQSGTAVLLDFVEFPSQILENWLLADEFLDRHAKHSVTGEPLPRKTRKAIVAASKLGQGVATTEYLASALLDLDFHEADPDALPDVETFERETLRRHGIPEFVGFRHRTAHFSHLFSGDGYACGYYAYMWAETLEADGFAAFEEKNDPFDPELAEGLAKIFSAGGSEDPMELYQTWRGRRPEINALLAKRGLRID